MCFKRRAECVTRERNGDRKRHRPTQPRRRDADERKPDRFRIEFETTCQTATPHTDRTLPPGYQSTLAPDRMASRTRREHQTETPNRKGCEFVSPSSGIRRPQTNRRRDRQDQRTRREGERELRIAHNNRCERRRSRLGRLIFLVGNHEKAIFASTAHAVRETTVYTKRIKHYGDQKTPRRTDAKRIATTAEPHHLAAGKNRIEFRAFARNAQQTKVGRIPDDGSWGWQSWR